MIRSPPTPRSAATDTLLGGMNKMSQPRRRLEEWRWYRGRQLRGQYPAAAWERSYFVTCRPLISRKSATLPHHCIEAVSSAKYRPIAAAFLIGEGLITFSIIAFLFPFIHAIT